MDAPSAVHVPVMLREVIEYLDPRPGQVIVDCTVGAGGHARELLRAVGEGGRLIGIDRDAEVLEVARRSLEAVGGSFELHHAAFSGLDEVLPGPVDGLLIDHGVSSLQFDRAGRGFSFQAEGPLDMRMDQSRGITAAEAIRRLPRQDLARVLRDYGEERFAGRIARAIKEAQAAGRLRTTADLAEAIRRAAPFCAAPRRAAGRGAAGRGGIDPATRTFQALRIYVNAELDELATLLGKLPGLLKPGGRAVVIGYHSLEDRIVKQAFREQAARGLLEILTRKPVRPAADEVRSNRRSRSARLRAARRL